MDKLFHRGLDCRLGYLQDLDHLGVEIPDDECPEVFWIQPFFPRISASAGIVFQRSLARTGFLAFADYPYCEKHKGIYELAKMQERQMQQAR
jgi:hypothetical protein